MVHVRCPRRSAAKNAVTRPAGLGREGTRLSAFFACHEEGFSGQSPITCRGPGVLEACWSMAFQSVYCAMKSMYCICLQTLTLTKAAPDKGPHSIRDA